MDRLQTMETFTRVVESGSFARAAETLRVFPSKVTKSVKDLEAHLGVQLLNRTTRKLSVTEAGLRYYDNCKAILHDVARAEDTVSKQDGLIMGSIQVSTTSSLARHFIIPMLPRFIARYPEIKIDLQLSDVDEYLTRQGIDCVFRVGEIPPSTLISRHIGVFHWYVCGAPDYLEQHGEPANVADLNRHIAVACSRNRTSQTVNWVFKEDGQPFTVSMGGLVSINDTDAYIAAGIAGLGLIQAPNYMVREALTDGRLIRLLPGVETRTEPLLVLYPQSRHLSPALRAFIDWCIEAIGQQIGL